MKDDQESYGIGSETMAVQIEAVWYDDDLREQMLDGLEQRMPQELSEEGHVKPESYRIGSDKLYSDFSYDEVTRREMANKIKSFTNEVLAYKDAVFGLRFEAFDYHIDLPSEQVRDALKALEHESLIGQHNARQAFGLARPKDHHRYMEPDMDDGFKTHDRVVSYAIDRAYRGDVVDQRNFFGPGRSYVSELVGLESSIVYKDRLAPMNLDKYSIE